VRERYFELATKICAQFDFDLDGNPVAEGNACRYAIATSRACSLLEELPEQVDLARRFFLDAASLVARDPSVVETLIDFKWFEYLGDSEEDHSTALFTYHDGLINDYARLSVVEKPNFHRPPLLTVVKYLGAAYLARRRPDSTIVEYALGRPRKSLNFVFDTSRSGLSNWQSESRWKEGTRQLKRFLAAKSAKRRADKAA
jgi:hypothetical protein